MGLLGKIGRGLAAVSTFGGSEVARGVKGIQKRNAVAQGKTDALAATYNMAKPQDMQFQGITGANGELNSNFQLNAPSQYSESPWLKQQLEQQGIGQTNAMNTAARTAASGTAQAQAGLARRGGLGGGAAERIAMQGAEQRALGAQDIMNQGMQQQLGLRVGDAQQQQAQQLDINKFNLQNKLGEIAAKRNFDATKYGQDMQAYGAERTALATLRGGK